MAVSEIVGLVEPVKRVSGRVDLHRSRPAVGNEDSVDKRNPFNGMVLVVAGKGGEDTCSASDC